MRDMAVMITAQAHWEPWGQFAHALRTGESAAQHAFGTDVFSWFQRPENKDEWDLFNAAMTSFSSGTSLAVAESYDFSRFGDKIAGPRHRKVYRAAGARHDVVEQQPTAWFHHAEHLAIKALLVLDVHRRVLGPDDIECGIAERQAEGAGLVDIGGGHGFLLKTILSKAPGASGVLRSSTWTRFPGAIEGANLGELSERFIRR